MPEFINYHFSQCRGLQKNVIFLMLCKFQMKIRLIHTGKTRFTYVEKGCDDYYSRIKRYIPFQEIINKDIKNTGHTGIEEIKRKEGEQLLKLIQPSDYLVLFDCKGVSHSSESFADFLDNLFMKGQSLIFATGGAYGFSEEVYNRSNYTLSLSKMTFSHQLVRLLVAEQLYRALTIIKGEPYHHA